MPKFLKFQAEQAPGPKSVKIKAVPYPALASVPPQEGSAEFIMIRQLYYMEMSY